MKPLSKNMKTWLSTPGSLKILRFNPLIQRADKGVSLLLSHITLQGSVRKESG